MRRKPCTVAPKSQCFGHDPRVAELAAALFEDEFIDTSDDDSPVEALAHALTVAFEDWAFEYESAHPKCTGCNKRRVLEGQLCELCASFTNSQGIPLSIVNGGKE